MVSREYAVWMKMGGKVDSLSIVDDVRDQLRDTVVYKRLIEVMTEENRENLLDKASMYVLAQEHVRLIHRMLSVKDAFDSGDEELVKHLLGYIFD